MAEFTDDDERVFYVVATHADRRPLELLYNEMMRELFPNMTWVNHVDDVVVRSGHTCELL
jgi:hypothetical protein